MMTSRLPVTHEKIAYSSFMIID